MHTDHWRNGLITLQGVRMYRKSRDRLDKELYILLNFRLKHFSIVFHPTSKVLLILPNTWDSVWKICTLLLFLLLSAPLIIPYLFCKLTVTQKHNFKALGKTKIRKKRLNFKGFYLSGELFLSHQSQKSCYRRRLSCLTQITWLQAFESRWQHVSLFLFALGDARKTFQNWYNLTFELQSSAKTHRNPLASSWPTIFWFKNLLLPPNELQSMRQHDASLCVI